MSLRIFQAAASALMTYLSVSGETDEIHLDNLHHVLQRLQERGLKLNPDRFSFMLDDVE